MNVVLCLLVCVSLKSTEGNNNTTPTGNNVSGSGNSTTALPTTQVKTTTVAVQEPSTKSSILTSRTVQSVGSTPQHPQNGTINGAKRISDGIPYWVYILIAVVIIVLGAIFIFSLVKYDRWKNQGSYMVWDSRELQLSPAFISRESEFLIDNLAAEQDPGSPELQRYEIPLESLGHPRVCISTKRVTPRNQTQSRTNKAAKERRKKDGQFQNQPSTLPRPGKRDLIYNSPDNGVNNALSEGDINDDQMNTLTSQGNGSKPISLGSLGKGGSTLLFQNRPLPAAPSKRFSKSLDHLRLLELFPNSKNSKAATIAVRSRPLPCLPTHPSLVKSASCGNNLNQVMLNSRPPPAPPPVKKNSLDSQENLGTSRSMLSHRHSKSLDTLLLLKELDWMSCDIDMHHSYESMHHRENKVDDSPYASVETSNQASPKCSDHHSSVSPTLQRSSQNPTNGEDLEQNDEHPYAIVSGEEQAEAKDLQMTSPLHCGRKPNKTADQSPSVSSEDTMPYASVRISQIPGLGPSSDHLGGADNNSSCMEVFEGTGSSLKVTAPSAEVAEPSRPASTLTYLEILPDNSRASMISETSSGYARPIDLCPNILDHTAGSETSSNKTNDHNGFMEPPVEILPATPDYHEDQDADTCIYVPMGPPMQKCENPNQDLKDSDVMEHKDRCVVKIEESDSAGNQEDNGAESMKKGDAVVFENVAFVGSLASEDSYL